MRALLINTAFLGDVVFSLPLAENLGLAGFEVESLTRPGYGALYRGLPNFRRALDFDKRGADRGLAGTVRQAHRLRAAGYDLVVGAHPSTRSGLLARATGAPVRVGWGPVGYTRSVPRGPRFVEDALDLARAARVPTPVTRPRLRLGGEAGAEDRVALIPGARWGTKRWPARHWAALARTIEGSGRAVTFVGGPGEEGLAPEGVGGRRLFDRPLVETARWLAGGAAVVGGDSGLVHLARAAGVPAVVLFGPTSGAAHIAAPGEVFLSAPSVPCRPCSPHGPRRCPRLHHRCMSELSVEAVYQGLQRALGCGT